MGEEGKSHRRGRSEGKKEESTGNRSGNDNRDVFRWNTLTRSPKDSQYTGLFLRKTVMFANSFTRE